MKVLYVPTVEKKDNFTKSSQSLQTGASETVSVVSPSEHTRKIRKTTRKKNVNSEDQVVESNFLQNETKIATNIEPDNEIPQNLKEIPNQIPLQMTNMRRTRSAVNKQAVHQAQTPLQVLAPKKQQIKTYKNRATLKPVKIEPTEDKIDDSEQSEPEIFQGYEDSEDEFKPPQVIKKSKPRTKSLPKKIKIEKEISLDNNSTDEIDANYSILAVDDPNHVTSWSEPFNEEWPSSEAHEKFPKNIMENGNILIKGKKLNFLVSKFYQLHCEICENHQKFTEIREMYQHYKYKHDVPGYVNCCGNKIHRYHMAVLHMCRHLQPEAFKCNICDYIVTRPKFLELHMKTHLPEDQKPFACAHCPKRFCWKNAYLVHLETHQPEGERKIYTCSICSRTYDTPGGLSTHKRLIHSEYKAEKHICHICAKYFSTKAGLYEHMQTIHQPREKNAVQCSECGSWLMNKRCLKTHMMLHSTQEYKCDQCLYTTKKHFLLKKHIITHHSTEKPFECKKCDKKFKLKRALTVHLQTAHDEENKKVYKCNFCDKQFASSTNFYTHRKNIHPKELQAMKEKDEENKRLKRIQAGLETVEYEEVSKEEYTVIYEEPDGTHTRVISLDSIGDSKAVDIGDGGQMIVIEIQSEENR